MASYGGGGAFSPFRGGLIGRRAVSSNTGGGGRTAAGLSRGRSSGS